MTSDLIPAHTITPLMPRLLLWLLLLRLPESRGRCIFDEVQSTVRVVSPPPGTEPITMPPRIRDTAPHMHVSPTVTTLQTPSPARQSLLWQAPPTAAPIPAHRRDPRHSAPPPLSSDRPPVLPIRIRPWTPSESPALSTQERQRLEPALAEALSTLTRALSVSRVQGRLLLSRDIGSYCRYTWRNSSAANYNRCGRANENYRTETCLDITIPDDHLAGCAVYLDPDSASMTLLRPQGAGLPDTDFLLYLHTDNTDKCRAQSSVVAYAAQCQSDAMGRPVAGVVVICRDRLTDPRYTHSTIVLTLLHEVIHTLGFSSQLYRSWRDCTFHTDVGGCALRGRVVNTDETGQSRVYTPAVISALNTHLNTPGAEQGAPLEDQGGAVSSHWETRVLLGSVMTAALGPEGTVRLDPITLAALQDTGWYRVNTSTGQTLEWGNGQGSLFGSLSTCHDNSSKFFCTGSGSGCHYLHLHKGQCDTDEFLNGCRIYKPLSQGSECWKGGSVVEEWSGEIYHSDSRCFFSSLRRENISVTVNAVAGQCYRHRCTGPNRYQVRVLGSDWVDCAAGGTTQVPGYSGVVFCPDRRLCHQSDQAPASPSVTLQWTAPMPSDSTQFFTILPGTSNSTMTPDSSRATVSRATLAAVLGSLSALCLLTLVSAALALSHWKHHSARVRVHAAGEWEAGGTDNRHPDRTAAPANCPPAKIP
ncbi:ciliated left-right organizer metallopeptidase [Amia ocellicauda]|uniref:ciliated left-right organizer metallopeptidase n=1 Tax=Amia ocellicauda TaxID=2972642 RepID=UPI0034641695